MNQIRILLKLVYYLISGDRFEVQKISDKIHRIIQGLSPLIIEIDNRIRLFIYFLCL